jgi:KDO2-lipid IV(A) lauroyltransferase
LRREKRLLFYCAVRGLRGLSTVLPRRIASRVFALLGDVVRVVDRPAVRRTLRHLEIAYGSTLSVRERRALMRETFRATGRNVADLLRASARGPDEASRHVDFEGLEHLDAALAKGRGVVALSAHLGHWELLGAALAARGYPLHVVARRLFDRRSDRLLNEWRRRCGLVVLPTDVGPEPAVRVLRRGGIVGALVDQDTGGPSVFAPFFGRPARTARAPFVIARRTGASLVPLWTRRCPDGRHLVTVGPALAPSRAADLETALREDATRWNALLEEAIRSNPTEWVWHHRRWKTPPPPSVRSDDLRDFSTRMPYLVSSQGSREMVNAR